MTEVPFNDPMAPMLIKELHDILTGEHLVDDMNLRIIHQEDGWLLLNIIVSVGRL